ncbi:HAD family hydrolase [Nesterenkonia flava]|uniref:HAD family hydrolase n=1 Tax=Nesterenkonia flava TaxID=469799 RepID=A0ABU1FR77_9MICC|nr:HAD family hydrolase [Nesterenkonia flava]MDR5710688.1 HAD family hydrolase [Nesterenkonia flava]
MSSLQAVFWDMDGTLVDTEPYWIEAEHELVEAHGGTWSHDQAQLLVGQALTYSASILQEAGVAMGNREIIDHLTQRVISRCRQQIPWRPGARELLEDLNAAGVRCALVTMSFKPLAQAIVDALPADHLEFIISGDMVSAGKPDPEAYHTAFSTMAADHTERTGEELHRARCVAIEDSVPGTAAAAASGMVTLAVPHFTPLPDTGQWHLAETLHGLRTADLQNLLANAPAPITA